MKRLFVLCSLVMLTALACATPPPESGFSEGIAAGAATWIDSFNAGDVDAIVAVYTEDALLMPPGAPAGRGEEILRAVFGGMIEAGMKGSTETVEIRSAADIGYHIGNYELTLDGNVIGTGKFIETWRLVDGQWKMAADIFNSDQPAAPAEPPHEEGEASDTEQEES